MKILIIEDEPELAGGMETYLTTAGYNCEFAADFETAMRKVGLYTYDCILLDLMLPGGDGMRILQEVKNLGKDDGVIVISARNSVEDRVLGLEVGADDYLVKPFHLSELSARIFSLLRRRQFKNSNIVAHKDLKIDLPAKAVYVHNTPLTLTKKEYELLLFFIGNTGKVISKGGIAEHLSGDVADMLDSHDFVYVHVKNLKRKLAEAGAADYLTTIYGNGYKWER